jgi:hypothetical protein
MKKVQDTCRCKAYKFPHRLGSGKCWGNHDGPFCECCGQPCKPVLSDVGIGHYEYWGQKCVDKQMVYTSDCCGSSVFVDVNLTTLYQ